MAALIPPVLISAPPPPPRAYGLFDVALGPMPFPVPEAAGGGIQYVPDTCVSDYLLYSVNCPPVSGSKTFFGIDAPVSGAPFSVITSYTCGSIGFSFTEVENRLRTRMALREQTAVEQRVWAGWNNSNGLGVMPGLFANAVNLGASSCLTQAVGLLEQALSDNGVVGGIIHARPMLAGYMAARHLVEHGPGRILRTIYGTPVVFGDGYPGTDPAGGGVTNTSEVMYATGRIMLWSGDTYVPPIPETMNRSTNQITALAEKPYVAAMECGAWYTTVTYSCLTL